MYTIINICHTKYVKVSRNVTRHTKACQSIKNSANYGKNLQNMAIIKTHVVIICLKYIDK